MERQSNVLMSIPSAATSSSRHRMIGKFNIAFIYRGRHTNNPCASKSASRHFIFHLKCVSFE